MFGIALGYVNGSDLSTPNAGTVALLGTAAAIFITLLIIVRLCSVVGSRFLPASALWKLNRHRFPQLPLESILVV
jgi:hypothetical protein